MSAQPKPYECDYCREECDELFTLVDDFPGTWTEPPHNDTMDVCAKCWRKFKGTL